MPEGTNGTEPPYLNEYYNNEKPGLYVDRGGLRYCMNSAALRFIPLDKMEEQGFGDYVPLVK